MTRAGTAGGALGIIAGSWIVVSYFLGCISPLASCPALGPTPPGLQGMLTVSLAALLILTSFVAFVGPSTLFYVGALICLIIDIVEIANHSSITAASLYTSLALTTLVLVLDVVAARHRTGVSEQSHPMNLPVFG